MYRTQTAAESPIPMQDFDSHTQVRALRKVLESIIEPRRRQILAKTIEHADAEGNGRYPELIATCSKKHQSYRYWGSGDSSLVPQTPQSYAELEAYYKGVIDSKTWMIHHELDKVIVGNHEVVMDGVIHQLYPSALIEPLFRFKPDPAYRAYQLTKRLIITFMFDEDGLSCGEHAYSDGPITTKDLTPVEDRYLPDLFKAA
jgi:hypothetical protein